MRNSIILVITTIAVWIALAPLPTRAQQPEVTCESVYTVQAGDFLTKIAAATLGNSKLYQAIIAATNAKAAADSSYHAIGQNNIIQPGWKLCIPAATAPEQPEATTPTAANPGPLAVDALANATYSGIYDEPVTLTNGKYEGEPFAEGGSSRPTVEYLNHSELYGDLNGDGVEDAAVFLVENSGGTGNFVYVAAQLNQNGQPVDAGAVWIEDRIQIISAVIENGQIKLEITAEGPGDAACCKSHKTTKTYALQNGQLAELPGEDMALEKITAADLNGTTWTLVELDVDQPALTDAPITLSFADGQMSGSAGCNSYNGSFTLSQDNPFVMTVGPVMSTQMACPEPIMNQETAYLAALQTVSQWGYQVGNLALYYGKDDGSLGRLLLAPATPAPTLGEAWQAVSCDTLGVAPEVAAVADCGTLTVPENRASSSDKTIQLAVVRVRSTAANPGAPVVLSTGGPGSNGLAFAADPSFLSSYAGILADRDWIFFSQRGTEFAQPHLTCPEFDNVQVDAALNKWSDEDRRAKQLAAMQSCYDGFIAQGVDFAAYNSNENAADVADIKQALGYDKIIYYGQSYGTLLGQFVLRNHPEILEAVILDGIVPAGAIRWSDVTDIPGAFQRVFAACTADAACVATYPDAENVLAEVFAALEADPQAVTVNLGTGTKELLVDGTLAMNGLFLQLYISGGYGMLPTLVYQMRDHDYSSLGQSLPLFLTPGRNARLMHFAIACSDDPVTSLVEVKTENVAPMYRDLVIDDANLYIANCPLLKVAHMPDSSDQLVTSTVPALLLQGGLDPATPVSGGNTVQSGLSTNYNVIFPTGTHIQGHSPCGVAIMDAFMTDPLTAPDTSCIDPQLHFAVPQHVTAKSPDGSISLALDLPAGYAPGQQSNQYQSATSILTFYAITPGTPQAGSIEEALKLVADSSVAPLDNTDIVDGDPVAGYPTKVIRAGAETQGIPLGIDLIAFENETGIYLIHSINFDPPNLETYRQNSLPAILKTVTVSRQ